MRFYLSRRYAYAFAFRARVIVVATILLLLVILRVTALAAPSVAIEAESASLLSNATVTASSLASGGSFISFQSATQPPAAPTGNWENITPPPPASFDFVDFSNYGAQDIVVAPSNPSIVYLGSCLQGIFKTTNGGTTWTKVNTGTNGREIDAGRNWTMMVDPDDPNILYTAIGYGRQGLWKSTNGGVDWAQILPQSLLDQVTYGGFVYHITHDPADKRHMLVSFQHSFASGGDGIIESLDGGTTWRKLSVPTGGANAFPFFLTSTTWIMGTEYDGLWRTTNSGQTWSKVDDNVIWHGSSNIYRASNGMIYMSAKDGIIRSSNLGASWQTVGPPDGGGGYHTIIGDGTYLYVMRSWSGQNKSYWISPETDGANWTMYKNGAQTFSDGPFAMAYDPVGKILYSSNWTAGVFRLRL